MAKRTKAQESISAEQLAAAEKQIRQIQREIRFDTRDFPIESIIDRFNRGSFVIPPYQREFVWNEKDQSQFIESVIMGLPIPMMFLAEDEEGIFEIVDGVQRITTLDTFVSGDLCLQDLETLTSLDGFGFADLPEGQQNKLLARALRIVVLDAETTDDNRRNLFHRINKSGRTLTASERRRGSLAGSFMEFLETCAADPVFREVCPVSARMDRRKEPLELVTRYFAYSDKYLEFVHDVDSFLDDFVQSHRDKFDERRYRDEFSKTMAFVRAYFPLGFAKSPKATSTPRVRFESLAVGATLALRENPGLKPHSVARWIESKDFEKHTTTHASNSPKRLCERIEYVRDRLLEG